MSEGIDWTAAHRLLEHGQRALDAATEMRGERLEALLRERASQLAQREATAQPGETLTVLSVRVGGERYGLDLAGLAGILTLGQCAPVPGGPAELLGVVRARGEIWAAYELRRLLGASVTDAPAGGHVVLLRHQRRRVALRVDEAEQVHSIQRDSVRRASNGEPSGAQLLIKGIGPDSMILIDLNVLWTHPAIGEAT